jgi:hypothetical protein
VAPNQWINEFHLITIIEAAPRRCVELRKIMLAHTKKETIKPTWLRRKLLSPNMLIHKLAHQDDPCVRECLVIVGAQDAPLLSRIDEAAHIEPLGAAVEVGRHAAR